MLSSLWSRISGFIIARMSDDAVERRYVEAGKDFGGAVSHRFLAEGIYFRYLFDRWATWEQKYSKRGYVTIPIDEFVSAGRYEIEPVGLGQKRATDQPLILFASIYFKEYLLGIEPHFKSTDD